MEHHQINNINNSNFEKKYNPLKDANFWIAFVLGGGPILLIIISQGHSLEPPFILNIIFLICWISWIIFKKGGKWSLIIGFIIALLISTIAFFSIVKPDIKSSDLKIQKIFNKFKKENQNNLKLNDMEYNNINKPSDEIKYHCFNDSDCADCCTGQCVNYEWWKKEGPKIECRCIYLCTCINNKCIKK